MVPSWVLQQQNALPRSVSGNGRGVAGTQGMWVNLGKALKDRLPVPPGVSQGCKTKGPTGHIFCRILSSKIWEKNDSNSKDTLHSNKHTRLQIEHKICTTFEEQTVDFKDIFHLQSPPDVPIHYPQLQASEWKKWRLTAQPG